MYLNFVTFNFKGDDIEAEERNYLDNQVDLVKRLPGLRFYYTGRLMEVGHRQPEHFRATILGYENVNAAAAAINAPDVIPALLAYQQEHQLNYTLRSMIGEIIVPLVARKIGRKLLAKVVEFDFPEVEGGPEVAAERYRKVHVELARRLPGLRKYLIGEIDSAGGWGSERKRMAILFFDSLDALEAAGKSPVGQQLIRDQDAFIRNARVWRMDARFEK
ncbi:MAG: EthD family reductase [Candidatus Binataceae bacterium]